MLKAIYVVVGEETIVKKNMQYENTADRCTNKRIRRAGGWSVVNEVTGRKKHVV